MKDMIWQVHGGSWRCSNCLTMPMCKTITEIKYCPNCGAKAIAYETELYETERLRAVITHPMELWTSVGTRWKNDDFLSDDFKELVIEDD